MSKSRLLFLAVMGMTLAACSPASDDKKPGAATGTVETSKPAEASAPVEAPSTSTAEPVDQNYNEESMTVNELIEAQEQSGVEIPEEELQEEAQADSEIVPLTEEISTEPVIDPIDPERGGVTITGDNPEDNAPKTNQVIADNPEQFKQQQLQQQQLPPDSELESVTDAYGNPVEQ